MVIDIGDAREPDLRRSGAHDHRRGPAANAGRNDHDLGRERHHGGHGQDLPLGNAGPSTTYALREMPAGLQKIVSTAANTVGGINAASAGSKFWDNLRDTTGGAISPVDAHAELEQGEHGRCEERRRRGDHDSGSDPASVRDLRLQVADPVREQKEFKGGFNEVSFAANGTPIKLYPDRHAPYGQVLILDKKHVRLFSPMDWSFLDKDGLSVRWVSDTDAYQVALFRYASLGVDRRNTSVAISGLTDTNGF
jgi:hypothetical protein